MRSTLLTLVALGGIALQGCSHAAYGPSSDQRLESSLSEGASSEGSDVSSVKCSDLKDKFMQSRDSEVPESERMQKMTEVFLASRDRWQKLDDAVSKNPDLLYSSNADSIKANLDECRSFFAEVRSDFDRFIRDVSDLPVIKDVASSKDVARIDLGVLRGAIVALDPDDKDQLIGRVEVAEKKTGYKGSSAPKKEEPAKATPPAKEGKKK
ncbi:MAG TPA: hypothetical protein VGK67_18425 [Myxococcales bacterium]|jgi:hypothetical protein